MLAVDPAKGRPRFRLLQREPIDLLHLQLHFRDLAVNPYPSIRILVEAVVVVVVVVVVIDRVVIHLGIENYDHTHLGASELNRIM